LENIVVMRFVDYSTLTVHNSRTKYNASGKTLLLLLLLMLLLF